MRRARLQAHDVTRIIITATMTDPAERVTVEELLKARRADGYLDLGWHYFIDANARVHFGVPIGERGSYFPRYSSSSVVFLIEGNGEYSHEQFLALRRVIDTTRREYYKAVPTMHYELFKGTNPGFDQGELYEP